MEDPMDEMTKILCITCPKGCSLEVTRDGETVVKVTGSGCKRGPDYARRELVDPRRMIATSVKIKNGVHPLLPVYTSVPFPKGKIMELQAALRTVEVKAPVKAGAIVVENILGTGINILASREISQKA
jgi:CxxC motif-containing protein